ncbi:hypothetical protein GCM10011374_30320 [Kocuria dechangensis]|uniref:Uncharacterized protein n=1 Tax=Kocuria dechangensis TaxID=1176249 RepID=A0A917LYT6_9MICC|nr:hypothetical protein [Kocuria dechangensis]GGG64593.1 hypothetical protein GCM10011374_30320 [Kocuria dechangensis]
MRPVSYSPLVGVAAGLIMWLALPSTVGPLNLALTGQIIMWVSVAAFVISLMMASRTRRASTVRREVADPVAGQRVVRSETDVV